MLVSSGSRDSSHAQASGFVGHTPHFLVGRKPITVFLFFLVIIVLPILILSIFAIYSSINNAKQDALASNDNAARLASQAISQRFLAIRTQLSSGATAWASRQSSVRPTGLPRELDELMRANTDLAFVTVLSPEGKVVARSPNEPRQIGMDMSSMPWYRQFVRSGSRPYVSNALRTQSPPRESVSIVVVPIKTSTGTRPGALIGAVRLSSIQAWLDTTRLHDGGYLYVTDRSGVVVARPGLTGGGQIISLRNFLPVKQALIGNSGYGRFFNPATERDELTAYVPVPGIGWSAVAQQPADSALASSYQLGRRIAVISSMLIALAIGISLLIAALYRRNQRLYQQLASSLTRERGIANALQESLMCKVPDCDILDIGIRHVSATAGALVGGDFFDIVRLSKDRVAIIIGDVCGKGVATAVQTAVVRGLIRGLIAESESPASLLSKMNERLITLSGAFISSDTFVTMIVGVFNEKDGSFLYSQGGHPSPVLCADNVAVPLPQLKGPALGVIPEAAFEDRQLTLGVDDMLLFYTDGLLETRHNLEFFGEERIVRIFGHYSSLSPQNVAERLFRECVRFARGKLSDDIAIMTARRPAGRRILVDHPHDAERAQQAELQPVE